MSEAPTPWVPPATDAPAPAAPSTAASHAELGNRAAGSAKWMILGYGASQTLRFASNAVLTYIFAPEIFGLINLANTFYIALGLFSDVGIRPSIVQSVRGDDPKFVNTAWTMQVLRGVGMWLVAIPLAYPYALWFEHDLLVPLIQVGGAAALLMGLNSSKLFTMNRHLNMKLPVVIDLVSQLAGIGVMVVGAWLYASPWAIVAGTIVTAGVKMALSHLWLPGLGNRLHWDKESASTLFSFGRWIFLSTLLTFIVSQGDRFIFGRAIDKNLFGVYTMAVNIAALPALALGQLADAVMLPLYSRTRESGQDLQPVFRNARGYLLLLGGWILSGFLAGGPTAVRLIYPDAYQDAGWMLQLLSFGVWFRILEMVNNTAIIAHGNSRWGAMSRVAMLVAMLGLIPLGFQVGGFAGAIAGYALAEVARYVVATFFLYRLGLKCLAQDLRLTALVVGSAVVARLIARAEESHMPVLLEALTVFVVVSAAWAPVLWPFLRTFVLKRGQPQATPA